MTVESDHIFDVHLGETLVPYATLEPLQVILPARKASLRIPTRGDSPGGVDPFSMGVRVRNRWRSMAELWDENKKPSDGKSFIEQIDYFGKLTAQFAWMRSGDEQIRVAYAGSGRPTAAVLSSPSDIADYTLFWIACDSIKEANFLLAVINSEVLYDAVRGLMPSGQFGPRHVQKHLWRLPLPKFDPSIQLHCDIAGAGSRAAEETLRVLQELRNSGKKVTVTIARREVRDWLANSKEGNVVESLVERLLDSTSDC